MKSSKPLVPPTQGVFSHFPFQVFDDALFCDLESEGVLGESLDVPDPSCYDKGNDVIENIDEFIHVGRRKWDVVGHDEDPIYDVEGHFQLFPLQQPYLIATNLDVWKQEDDMITNLFQTPNNDLLQYSHDDIWSCLKSLMLILLSTWIYSMKNDFQPPLCSDFDKGEDMVFLKQGYL
jgi:hypothetical protein